MAIFPSAVATDSDLYIAVNNIVTDLTAGIDNVVLTIPVTSTVGFPADGCVTVGTEIIKYSSKTATQFNASARGFDGTTASSHSSGDLVHPFVIAVHHNVLKDEVKAIEQNLSDRIGLSASAITLAANLNANSFKVTSLAAATTNGDAVRYEQVIGQYLLLSGGTLTGALLVSSGSVSSPSLAPSGDSNTGIYWSGVDGQLDFSTNGTQRAYLNGGGLTILSADLTVRAVKNTGGVDIQGTNTNDSASSGDVGEYIESRLASSGRITSGTSGAGFAITSISLSAGDWDIFGVVQWYGDNNATVTAMNSATSATSGAVEFDGVSGLYQPVTGATITTISGQTIPTTRYSLSGTTTVYLNTALTFTGTGNPAAWGRISARRIR